jgi:hypothetical protein
MQKFPPMISLANFCDFMRIIRKRCFFDVKCVFLVKIGHFYKIIFFKKETLIPTDVLNVIEWCLYFIPNTKA